MLAEAICFFVQGYLTIVVILVASWGSAGDDAGDAPQLKLARCFSLDEIKSFTNNFSTDNEIGSGGYGKVRNLLFHCL